MPLLFEPNSNCAETQGPCPTYLLSMQTHGDGLPQAQNPLLHPTRVVAFGFLLILILHRVALRQQKVVNNLLSCPARGSLASPLDVLIH